MKLLILLRQYIFSRITFIWLVKTILYLHVIRKKCEIKYQFTDFDLELFFIAIVAKLNYYESYTFSLVSYVSNLPTMETIFGFYN